MNKLKITTMLVISMFSINLFAQTKTTKNVNIYVTDGELEMPLEGAHVVVEGNGIIVKGETDIDGILSLELDSNIYNKQAPVLTVQYPGYDDKKISLEANQTEINVTLVIEGVIEGKEIVISGQKSESGVSKVLDKTQIATTANMGVIEDAINSVKTLPGVSYSSSFSGDRPSVRGGNPDELAAIMDGVYLIQPYQWGGINSIFNPHMIDSVKLSHGVYSARYGHALSGVLEVSTLDPNPEKLSMDIGMSTMSLNAFLQTPIGEHNALFLGTSCSYLEGLFWMYDSIGATEEKLRDTIPTAPYIRDFYAKWKCTPTDKFNFSLNAFFGQDGIGTKSDISKENAKDNVWGKSSFDYIGSIGFAVLNLNYMPVDKVQVKGILAYNFQMDDVNMYSGTQGTYNYSSDFLSRYDTTYDSLNDGKINGNTSYVLPLLESSVKEKLFVHEAQGKIESTIQLSENNSIAFGAEEIARFSSTEENISQWIENYASGSLVFEPMSFNIKTDGNIMYQSSAYGLWEFGSESTLFSGELGLRLDHVYVGGNNMVINTYPTINPRSSIHYTPIRNKGIFDSVIFSAGAGLFSQANKYFLLIDKKMNISNFEIGTDQLAMFVLGTQANLSHDWSFSLEGYYKQYLKRFYFAEDTSNPLDTQYDVNMNGKGYITGFDMMVQKKGDGIFNGYISYSFVYARYLNPYIKKYEGQTANGSPLDEWYYPSYHRFHVLNLVSNFNFGKRFTLSVMGTLATGKPVEETTGVTTYPVQMADGTVIQRYTRSSFYSDTLRTEISCPIDLKFTFKGDQTKRVQWEVYIAAEDILVNLYSPKGSTSLNAYTGKEEVTQADFNIGLPMPSIGFNVRF